MQALSAAAEEKAVASARAELLELHDLKLPSDFKAGGAARYLDRAMDKLKLDLLPQQPDLSDSDLVKRNELMQCVHLHALGADIAPGMVGQLHPGRSPFKNPRGPSYRFVDSDVETTMRHATMRQIDETAGSSWSVAASSKGAVWFGAGLAAWSESVSAAHANETRSSEMHSASSETTTHVKVKQAILSGTQFSLADEDWELTPKFESSLVALAEALAEMTDADGKTALARRLLDEYGSHLATQAVLGGRYKIECHVTTESSGLDDTKRRAVADALNSHASAAAAGVGFFEAFAGAGDVGGSTAHESHQKRQEALQTTVKTTHSETMLSMTVTGGAPGKLTAWLNDLRKSNRGWEVVDRSPHRGLLPIWDLVRHKSRRLSAKQQEVVSDSVKTCFDALLVKVKRDPKGILPIDGGFGPMTTAALQTYLSSKKHNPGPIDGDFGSKTKTALQTYLSSEGQNPGPADGNFGSKTKRALQTYLSSKGQNPGPADGNFGTKTKRALQTHLHSS